MTSSDHRNRVRLPSSIRLLALCGTLLAMAHTLPAIVQIIPEEPKPTAKPAPKVKPKPKPTTPKPKTAAPATQADPASELSRKFVGTWSGSRTGTGTIVGREQRYPYQVTSPVTVVVSDQGRSASVLLGSGQIHWSGVGPEGQTVSDFAAKPHPSFAVREQNGVLTGTFRTSDGNWLGNRTVTLTLDPTGQTLRLNLDHTGRNRQSGVTDSSTSEGLLQRKGGR
jgi:hypothetical protein